MSSCQTLTIKLNKVKLGRLPISAGLDLLGKFALTDTLALGEDEDDNDRNGKEDVDNAKGAKCPSEIGVMHEQICNLRASKDGADDRCALQAE